MLKPIYRFFLIAGMAMGVITGVFFLCSFQRQLADQTAAEEARRAMAQSAVLYRTPKETPENTLLALNSMSLSECERAMEAIPKGWQYAPIAQRFRDTPVIKAEGLVLSDVEVLYSTPSFFPLRGMEFPEEEEEPAAGFCAVSQSFLEAHGWEQGTVPTLEIDGVPKKITAVFTVAQAASQTEFSLLSSDTSLLLVLPYEEAPAASTEVFYILLQKPEELSQTEFRAELSSIEETLNQKYGEGEILFRAQTGSDFEAALSPKATDATTFLGIVFLAFLGELLAGINLMSLASAGILENRRHFGIKLAAGASYGDLFREFLAELLALCAKGTLLGMAASAILVYYANRAVGDFLFLFNGYTVAASACVMVLVCLISSYLPFRQILKEEPAALLQKEPNT